MQHNLTLQEVKSELSAHAMTISRRDGEYRVTFEYGGDKWQESCAYYTDDLEDALKTGLAMSEQEGH